jgi:hypothetical protein
MWVVRSAVDDDAAAELDMVSFQLFGDVKGLFFVFYASIWPIDR